MIWDTFIYNPLYNIYIYILGLTPGANLGIAVILFTVVVKTALFPLYQSSIRSQRVMKKIEPEIKKLQERYKEKKDELGKAMIDVYRKHQINPFSSLFALIIQIPILIALYLIFSRGVAVHTTPLYSWVTFPESIEKMFFGAVDMTLPFLLFSVLAGATQALQARVSFSGLPPLPEKKKKGETPTFSDEFAKTMRVQMLYVLPVCVVLFSLKMPAAVTLYWVVANTYSILQELYVKRRLDAQEA